MLVEHRPAPSAPPARTCGDANVDASAHGSSPRIGGTRNRPSSTAGACEHLGPVERGPDHVGPQHVDEAGTGAPSADVGDVERLDVGGVVEHGGELAGEHVELVVGQPQAGEPGHVGDVVAGDALGHDQ